ncbi:MAG TPA: TrkA family potassium uptake protein [Candidatus Sulfotelmatobacter sp.]|nr:TrkA family potassium uptake protein [Candidatus Sulfotelmatobacter sp.]
MRVIIVGCGRVGSHLANALSAERHDVVVIDRRPASFGRLSREFSGRMLTGIGFDRDILQKADIEGAEALAATTDSDNVNIVVAVTAKETFHVPHVVARIYNAQTADIYRREGIPTVTPTLWGANTMRAMISQATLGTITTFGSGEVQALNVQIPRHLAGRRVEELNMAGEARVTILIRRGAALIPPSDMRLEEGDLLYLVATASAVPRLEKLLAH